MTRRISDRDWQELSSHLDGQLPAKEAARLENRLQQSADLRAAYEELRRVQVLLRSQPRLRAPRNFTLSAKTAGMISPRQSPSRLAPAFGLISAIASVMLGLVIAGELLVGRSQTAVPAAAEPVMEAVVTEAVSLLQAEGEATSKAVPMERTPAAGLRAYPPPGASEPGAVAAQAPEAPPAEYPAPEAAEDSGQEADILSMAVEEAAAVEQEESAEVLEPPLFANRWRLVQALLLVVVLTSALAAAALRRNMNR